MIKWPPPCRRPSNAIIVILSLLLSHLYHVFARCVYNFDSRTDKSGNFSSLKFPNSYPGGVTCLYVFHGQEFEGLKITFLVFELEAPYKAGCLADYMDISTLNSRNERHLLGRFCGNEVPSPVLTMQPHVELVFRTNYVIQQKGFFAKYEFLHEKNVPAPTSTPNRSGCGGLLDGLGGVVTSPGYPNFVPSNVDCVWLIRVDTPKHVHIRITDLQFQGSLANCDRMELSFYDGYTGFAYNARQMQSLCGDLKYYRNVEDRFILSPRNRLIIRFQAADGIQPVTSGMVGFKLVWTEVTFTEMDQCSKFSCKRSHYCIRSSPNSPCSKTKQYCIDSSLVCDGVQNCSDDDSSDEDDCYIPLMIGVGATVPAVFITVLIVAIVVKRQIRVRKSSSQTQNLTMHLRQLEHSPSSSGRPMVNSYSQPCDLLTPTMSDALMINGGTLQMQTGDRGEIGCVGHNRGGSPQLYTCATFKGLPTTV